MRCEPERRDPPKRSTKGEMSSIGVVARKRSLRVPGRPSAPTRAEFRTTRAPESAPRPPDRPRINSVRTDGSSQAQGFGAPQPADAEAPAAPQTSGLEEARGLDESPPAACEPAPCTHAAGGGSRGPGRLGMRDGGAASHVGGSLCACASFPSGGAVTQRAPRTVARAALARAAAFGEGASPCVAAHVERGASDRSPSRGVEPQFGLAPCWDGS